MSGMTFDIEINGATRRLTVSMGDLIRFERWAGHELTKDMSKEELAYLIWLAASRTQVVDVDFEGFLDVVGGLPESVAVPKAKPSQRSRKSSR